MSLYHGLLKPSLAVFFLLTASLAQGGDSMAATETDATVSDTERSLASGFTAADEAVYQQRFKRLLEAARSGVGLNDYDPVEAIAGARSVTPLPLKAASDRDIEPEALAAARAYAEKMNSNALLVWLDDGLELEAYFGAHGADDPVISRSLAKPLTAIAVGRAIELGYIESLDQPVSDFVVEWQGDDVRERILVRHLLDMHSGLLPQGRTADPDHILNRAYLHPRHDEVIIREYPVVEEPGVRFDYSNATAELVAVVIERASGQRYAEFISGEILQPLGAAGGEVWVNRPGGTAHSGCCMLLPAQSWLRLAKLLLDDGTVAGERLLPAGYVDAMREPSPDNARYGLGIYLPGEYIERRGFSNPDSDEALGRGVLHSEPYLAEDLLLFDGNANQVAYIIPSRGLIVLRTGFFPPRGLEWDNSYLINLILANIH
jgi:CubicO group peptidase (beta-lactamase class C family)